MPDQAGGSYRWRGELRLWDYEALRGWYRSTDAAVRSSTVIRRALDHLRKRLSPGKVVSAWVPPGVLAHGWSVFHWGAEDVPAVAAGPRRTPFLDQGGTAARRLSRRRSATL